MNAEPQAGLALAWAKPKPAFHIRGGGEWSGRVWASVLPNLYLPYIVGWRLCPMRRRVVADL